MAYHYENLKLEKGMYGQSGRSFAQTLEALDPSENYKGTSLEGLDAFQRQLKRFDIRVKGAGSDMVEKFFHTTDSAVRVTHFPSGTVVTCQNERSQIQNKAACMQILKARLYEIELEKRAEALDEIRGPKTTIGFGNQIRSYVLYPYQMVKDLRTGVETSNVEAVLDDGDLDPFVIGYHRWATGNADAEGSEV